MQVANYINIFFSQKRKKKESVKTFFLGCVASKRTIPFYIFETLCEHHFSTDVTGRMYVHNFERAFSVSWMHAWFAE